MTATVSPKDFKITYTSTNADMGEFHRLFDEALVQVKASLGQDHPLYINNKAIKVSTDPIVARSPIDTNMILGRFSRAQAKHADIAMKAAQVAQKEWGARPWQERVQILRQAATIIRERKFKIGAVMSLEVGKSRMEALGDAEESADLIDYYARQVEETDGFRKTMGKLMPNENAVSVLRPFGVFVCIAPFNFPMALSTGMSSAALLSGNTVVYKPAKAASWTGLMLYECYRDAGVPAGVFNYLPCDANVAEVLWRHPAAGGVVFTGSKEVGMRIFHEFSSDWVKPVLMELGGKNAAIVTESADLDMAAEGIMKSAFGLQGQKCSACSRVYVDKKVADAFIQKLLTRTAAIRSGNPTQKDIYFGPVINADSVKRFEKAVAIAKRTGKILCGSKKMTDGLFDKGFFVEPTIARIPLGNELFFQELFVPFLAVGVVESLEQALIETNKAEYGLTAGIFTSKKDEIEKFFNGVEAGVCYANRRTGATTGAWPGVQPFCGWKGSGSTGKGGCGPYYVAQFMREQSRTIME